jgi:ABC-type lipoprotein export system ATPase subunit
MLIFADICLLNKSKDTKSILQTPSSFFILFIKDNMKPIRFAIIISTLLTILALLKLYDKSSEANNIINLFSLNIKYKWLFSLGPFTSYIDLLFDDFISNFLKNDLLVEIMKQLPTKTLNKNKVQYIKDNFKDFKKNIHKLYSNLIKLIVIIPLLLTFFLYYYKIFSLLNIISFCWINFVTSSIIFFLLDGLNTNIKNEFLKNTKELDNLNTHNIDNRILEETFYDFEKVIQNVKSEKEKIFIILLIKLICVSFLLMLVKPYFVNQLFYLTIKFLSTFEFGDHQDNSSTQIILSSQITENIKVNNLTGDRKKILFNNICYLFGSGKLYDNIGKAYENLSQQIINPLKNIKQSINDNNQQKKQCIEGNIIDADIFNKIINFKKANQESKKQLIELKKNNWENIKILENKFHDISEIDKNSLLIVTVLTTYEDINHFLNSLITFLQLGFSILGILIYRNNHKKLLLILKENTRFKSTKELIFPKNIKQLVVKNIKYEVKNMSGNNEILILNFNYVFNAGDVYIVIGPNGVGKTTVTYSIGGIEEGYQSGEIYYIDESGNITNKNDIAYKEKKKFEHVLPVISSISIPDVTVGVWLNSLGNLYNPDRTRRIISKYKFLEFIEQRKNLLNVPIEHLSAGEKQKINIFTKLLYIYDSLEDVLYNLQTRYKDDIKGMLKNLYSLKILQGQHTNNINELLESSSNSDVYTIILKYLKDNNLEKELVLRNELFLQFDELYSNLDSESKVLDVFAQELGYNNTLILILHGNDLINNTINTFSKDRNVHLIELGKQAIIKKEEFYPAGENRYYQTHPEIMKNDNINV